MLAIIQARMSSRRFPGKMLVDVGGDSLLGKVIKRVLSCESVTRVVVATSNETSDDALCEAAHRMGIEYFRGSLSDVAGRLINCGLTYNAEVFIRVNGDSPLICPSLLDEGCRLFARCAETVDIVTNVMPRTFPRGQSVEVIRTDALERGYKDFFKNEHFEHVTPYFYAHPEHFRIENFSSGHSMGDIQLSVDTLADLQAVEVILQHAGGDVSWKTAATLKQEMCG